jgi:hypothetical protein
MKGFEELHLVVSDLDILEVAVPSLFSRQQRRRLRIGYGIDREGVNPIKDEDVTDMFSFLCFVLSSIESTSHIYV